MSASSYTLTSAMALKAARNRFSQLPRRVNDSQTVIPITRKGRPVMAVMSWEMFEALVDTIEILSDTELMTGNKRKREGHLRRQNSRLRRGSC